MRAGVADGWTDKFHSSPSGGVPLPEGEVQARGQAGGGQAVGGRKRDRRDAAPVPLLPSPGFPPRSPGFPPRSPVLTRSSAVLRHACSASRTASTAARPRLPW
jgi:hypothetical protein